MKPKTGNNANGVGLLTRGSVYVAVVTMFLVGRAFTQSPTPASDYELKRINLPGATGAVALDYFAYDRATGKLWVPASNTGSVDVIDEKTDAVSQITGFPTGEIERNGKKITVGTTAAIDVRTHNVVAKWNPGSADLEGLALDPVRRFLFVACGDHVVSIDAGHGGKVIDSMATGPGLDNIDYSADAKLLYAAASLAATLTIAEVGDDGKFHLKATVPTVKGARGVVAGKGETAYLIDPAEGRILKLIRK